MKELYKTEVFFDYNVNNAAVNSISQKYTNQWKDESKIKIFTQLSTDHSL